MKQNRVLITILKGFIGCVLLLTFGIYGCIYLYIAAGVNGSLPTAAESAIVFGARSYKNGEYNPCLVSRVEKAVSLYNDNWVEKLILSGGNDEEDGVNEAETMQKIALEKGIPQQAILLEKKATSSYENVFFSKEIMNKNRINSAILVSEPFHLARIELTARSLGMVTMSAPASDSPCWTKWKYGSRYFLKEPIAIIQYLLTGKIQLSAFTTVDKL